jgi:hypothetical protein
MVMTIGLGSDLSGRSRGMVRIAAASSSTEEPTWHSPSRPSKDQLRAASRASRARRAARCSDLGPAGRATQVTDNGAADADGLVLGQRRSEEVAPLTKASPMARVASNGSRIQPSLAGRRSAALIHRCRPFGPRTRPNHSRRSRTHQSSVPAADHVATCTSTGGSTAWRSASPY